MVKKQNAEQLSPRFCGGSDRAKTCASPEVLCLSHLLFRLTCRKVGSSSLSLVALAVSFPFVLSSPFFYHECSGAALRTLFPFLAEELDGAREAARDREKEDSDGDGEGDTRQNSGRAVSDAHATDAEELARREREDQQLRAGLDRLLAKQDDYQGRVAQAEEKVKRLEAHQLQLLERLKQAEVSEKAKKRGGEKRDTKDPARQADRQRSGSS